MIVEIGAPAVRALNANEKTVYKLLREGKSLQEIAKIMRMPVQADFAAPIPSIKGIITSIREKRLGR